MCISCELHDKWPPLIEFCIWILLQGLDIGNHYGVWAVIQSHVIDITPSTFKNITLPRNITSNRTIATSTTFAAIKNHTEMFTQLRNISVLIHDRSPQDQWSSLIDFRLILLIFCGIGTLLFVVHACLLIPNVIQSFRVKDPALLSETGNSYFRSVLKIHCSFLVLETILFDIPAGCLTMELLSLIWEGPLDETTNMEVSKTILTLSLIGLAFIALYKGKKYKNH